MTAEEGPAEYKKLVIKQYAARSIGETAEGRYWKAFTAPASAKQIGAITCIDFCSSFPHHFAVTASTRVLLYDAAALRVRRTFSRFKDVAFSGTFRSDGKLLVAGGLDGMVQVMDANSRAVLRQLHGHKSASRAVRFAQDAVHVLSGGDDATVRYWDVTSGQQIVRLDGHEDYVRAVAPCPSSADVWLTGGYDHAAYLWDVRSGKQVGVVDHGGAVEAVAWLPSGTAFVTVGGTEVRVWDALTLHSSNSGGGGGGNDSRNKHATSPLATMGNHQKTVSCCTVLASAGPSSGGGPRLLTGSLDGHVKIYELDTFKVTYVARYPSPILSLGVAPDTSVMAVGMSDGMLSVRRNTKLASAQRAAQRARMTDQSMFDTRQRFEKRLTAANYKYFMRGQSSKVAAEDHMIAAQHGVRLAPYDSMLRQFRYSEALDAALLTRRPEVVASVMEELASRQGLTAALGGRDAVTLPPLVAHVARYIVDPRYAPMLSTVAHMLLDIYAGGVGVWEGVDAALGVLRDRVASEVALQQEMASLGGLMEPLIAAGVSG